MIIYRTHSRYFAFFLLVCFYFFLFACSKRILAPMNPESLQKERLLHVKLVSGKEINVREPKFTKTFLLGKIPLYDSRPGPYKEIKVPLNEIDSIRVERFSPPKTLLVVAIIVTTLGLFQAFASSWGSGFN